MTFHEAIALIVGDSFLFMGAGTALIVGSIMGWRSRRR